MDFELFGLDDEIEDNVKTVSSRSLKIQEKAQAKLFLKKEKAEKVLLEIPAPGESLHIVSNGSFDYFTLIPLAINLLQKPGDFYFSTWTMNKTNVNQMFELYDSGKIKSINALLGLYFKKREANVFNQLYEGCLARKQRLFVNRNYSKVTLLDDGSNYIVIEGSANFTANPRIEQFVVTNNKELHDFHREWMEETLDDGKHVGK